MTMRTRLGPNNPFLLPHAPYVNPPVGYIIETVESFDAIEYDIYISGSSGNELINDAESHGVSSTNGTADSQLMSYDAIIYDILKTSGTANSPLTSYDAVVYDTVKTSGLANSPFTSYDSNVNVVQVSGSSGNELINDAKSYEIDITSGESNSLFSSYDSNDNSIQVSGSSGNELINDAESYNIVSVGGLINDGIQLEFEGYSDVNMSFSPYLKFVFEGYSETNLVLSQIDKGSIIYTISELFNTQPILGRTIFSKNCLIHKKGEVLSVGNDAQIVSFNEIDVWSEPFNDSHVGMYIKVYGDVSGANNGEFKILNVINKKRVKVDCSGFYIIDEIETFIRITRSLNELKKAFNNHMLYVGPHYNTDDNNMVVSDDARYYHDSVVLINEIKQKFNLHIVNDTPHYGADTSNTVLYKDCDANKGIRNEIGSIILLLNELNYKFNNHRHSTDYHDIPDVISKNSEPFVNPVIGSGQNSGLFGWEITDKKYGQLADDPSDVTAEVNGFVVGVDAVFGDTGAVVLTNTPVHGDDVRLSYFDINKIFMPFSKLNSVAYVLNSYLSNTGCGFDNSVNMIGSYLINPENGIENTSKAPFEPMSANWKFIAEERAQSALLNDPTTLIMNVPTNKYRNDVFEKQNYESTIVIDGYKSPESTGWTLCGNSYYSLIPGSDTITINSVSKSYYIINSDLSIDSIINESFRAGVSDYEPLGCFSGSAFGAVLGNKIVCVGFVETNANSLESSIVRLNEVKNNFNIHVRLAGQHIPNDLDNFVISNDATDKNSLVSLYNNIKYYYNNHVRKHGVGVVHTSYDSLNQIYTDDITINSSDDLIISLINDMTLKFNTHIVSSSHYIPDSSSTVGYVHQIGVLTGNDFSDESNWVTKVSYWKNIKTYRVNIANNTVSLYTTDNTDPVIKIDTAVLPLHADVDIEFDSVGGFFFGNFLNNKCSSFWNLARININPINDVLSLEPKNISYTPVSTPDTVSQHEWIRIGDSGVSLVNNGKLVINSSSSTKNKLSLTGDTNGYIRCEPSINSESMYNVEIACSVDYNTSGISRYSCGLFIGDNGYDVGLSFLSVLPQKASVIGSTKLPIVVQKGDTLIINDGLSNNMYTFDNQQSNIQNVVTLINQHFGWQVVDVVQVGSNTHVKMLSSGSGSKSSLNIVGGTVLSKFGINPGVYTGSDSIDSPSISYYNSDPSIWQSNGDQFIDKARNNVVMVDESLSGYSSITLTDDNILSPIISSNTNWKLGFNIYVHSSTPGDQILSGGNLKFCGAYVSIDEGVGGKKLDVMLTSDLSGNKFVSFYTYNHDSDILISLSDSYFNWDDKKIHRFYVTSDKTGDTVSLFIDDSYMTSFQYSSLYNSDSSRVISFGTGMNNTSNATLDTSMSKIEWYDVFAYNDVLSNSNAYRCIGVYKGGDEKKLSSYDTYNVEWFNNHTYTITKDPSYGVSIKIDDGSSPVLILQYDNLSLPHSSNSVFSSISNGCGYVAFGCFDQLSIVKQSVSHVKYYVSNLSLSDNTNRNNNVINSVNYASSYNHVRTDESHEHYHFSSCSCGTPSDDFMSLNKSNGVLLNDTTVPYQITQDVATVGGITRIMTEVNSVSSVGVNDSVSSLVDDTIYVVGAPDADYSTVQYPDFSKLYNLLNNILNMAALHSVKEDSHNYIIDTISYYNQFPNGNVVADAVKTANHMKLWFNKHALNLKSHINAGTPVQSPDAYDYDSCVTLANELKQKFNYHLTDNGVHGCLVYVSFEQPVGAIYDAVRSYVDEVGEIGHLFPFDESINSIVIGTPYTDSYNNVIVSYVTYTMGSSSPVVIQ